MHRTAVFVVNMKCVVGIRLAG